MFQFQKENFRLFNFPGINCHSIKFLDTSTLGSSRSITLALFGVIILRALNIITPNRASVIDLDDPNVEVSKNFIEWQLIPGKLNSLKFSFWNWNKLLLGYLLILLLMLIAYVVRFYRYQIRSNFPELPSN